ncbi:MAG: tRNA epoxyqueuosine(34) reductase QueG [Verrucomicrobiae bacterium]|nr:tRNA epoxyqueuosine(34) reductase QueG [Verrucomicrobiae bacterium]
MADNTVPQAQSPPLANDRAAEIKTLALQLGFDVVGITSARSPQHAAWFTQWLAQGFHAGLAYMERRQAERVDPQRVLPGARSVVVVGMNYYSGDPVGPGRVARYAQGQLDYHDVLAPRLATLAARICAWGAEARWYVDTGPVLERDFAERAGVGFIGKHTNLISRRYGNWLVLGAVLTTLDLPADPPARNLCGRCTRCLEACPTGAIVAPFQLDARRCISFWTIEWRGRIPEEWRIAIGDRLFGCDDCLEVCPWNRFAQHAAAAEFRPRALPALTEMLTWDDRQFREFFQHTPIFRLKRGPFLRNVCIVLGNCGDSAALPALERALHDPDPLVREHAEWAITQVRTRRPKLHSEKPP